MSSTDLRSTQERILDTAEQLFAQRGYYGVSLRDITSACGTALNMVRYHFGSKDDLFRAVTGRRTEAMNEALLRALVAAQSDGAPLELTQIVCAYVTVIGRLNADPAGWHNYLKLVIHSDSLVDRPELLNHMRESYQPVFEGYVAAFESTGLSHEDACWSMHFMHTSVAQMAVDVYSIAQLSHGVCDANAQEGFQRRLVTFIAAGIRAFMTQPPAQ
ncbi:MAG: TetR/AcrR family transcriptional regulator [Rhodocyclaceae bacterium]|jgi:AcrR family transcriptional regulator|nr:TetR/AcrR family transcriptional regulator [Rhodocyclaceae bacterium]